MVKFFNFTTDGHYGYPDINNISSSYIDPLSEESLIASFKNSSYSAYSMSYDGQSEPDEDDFESVEEYNAAMEEYEEESRETANSLYSEWGHFDVFDYTYLVVTSSDIDISNTVSDIMGYDIDVTDSREIHEDFMVALSEKEGINMVISFSNFQLAIKGELSELELEGSEGLTNANDVVIRLYQSGDKINAAKLYGGLIKESPEIESYVAQVLSPEDMEGLKRASKGTNMTGRFSKD
jgi:hypothetical protein